MKRLLQIIVIVMLLFPIQVKAAPSSGTVRIPNGPKFWISDVVRNESVKVSFANYPKGKEYYVYLSHVGGRLREYKVGKLKKTYLHS